MRNEMMGCFDEPTLDEMLSDSIVEAVMEADAVDPRELDALLSGVARTLHKIGSDGARSRRAAGSHRRA
jgi:hypothetical protein